MMKRILIVEDDVEILWVLEYLFTEEGLAVQGADTHLLLGLVIETFLPDVILMDIRLGMADGRKICQDLKGSLATQHIPIILMSASDSPLLDNGTSANQNAFISKPFDIIKLVALVNSQFSPLLN